MIIQAGFTGIEIVDSVLYINHEGSSLDSMKTVSDNVKKILGVSPFTGLKMLNEDGIPSIHYVAMFSLIQE